MNFLVIYDEGKNSNHVSQIHCSANDTEQAIKKIKELFPDCRILGVLLLNSEHTANLVSSNFTVACKIEDDFRNTIRDNIVSYENKDNFAFNANCEN